MDPNDEKFEMPKFEPEVIDVDPDIVERMNPADQLMHKAYTKIREDQSIRKQQIKWLCEQLAKMHKIVMELSRDKKTVVHLPYRIIGWISITLGSALAVKLIDVWLKKP